MEAIFSEKKRDGPQACVYSMVTNARPVQREGKPEPDDQNCDKCCTEVIGQHTKHDSHDWRYGRNGELLWKKLRKLGRKITCIDATKQNFGVSMGQT